MAFDMLLTWSRRDRYTLGFGPFPIILSINLFMWFRPDWFYLQFVMVAVGFAVKELVRWNKEGRRVHIFNPSSFPLGLFSLVLILTGTTHLTWGLEIAITQIYPPHIYLVIFLVSLPAQLLFGVASMTLSAVATTYIFILVHTAVTGTQFLMPSLPIAVFLGMHLLFNDPSTSPRMELGRIVFGMLYGLGVVALFGLLESAGISTHYDKLLAVPVLNLLDQGHRRCGSVEVAQPLRAGDGRHGAHASTSKPRLRVRVDGHLCGDPAADRHGGCDSAGRRPAVAGSGRAGDFALSRASAHRTRTRPR